MRTTTALLTSALVLPALALTTAPISAAAPQAPAAAAPAVKKVQAGYGARQVRLEPRQGVDITFRARSGDQVFLAVTNKRYRGSPCFGSQTIRDGRGTRRTKVDGVGSAQIVTVRTTGRIVLGFRGYCAANKGQSADPVAVQLTKVRMREVGRNDRTTVRAARRGFVDIAYVTVRQRGRDTLTIRSGDGTTQDVRSGRVLRGSRLSLTGHASSASVEAGHRAALDGSTYGTAPRLRAGERIGLVVPARGYAESLRARVHRTTLDAPAITLQADPGREDVLVYPATAADRPYPTAAGLTSPNGDLADPTWYPWRTYSGGADRRDASLRRTIFASDPDGAGPQELQVRVRRTVRVADLVVGGAPVTFAGVEPGTRFAATIPATGAGTVRLSASNVSATGPWDTDVPPTVCYRDCLYTGLQVSADKLVADGTIQPGRVNELQFTFGADASGSVTLQLADIS